MLGWDKKVLGSWRRSLVFRGKSRAVKLTSPKQIRREAKYMSVKAGKV